MSVDRRERLAQRARRTARAVPAAPAVLRTARFLHGPQTVPDCRTASRRNADFRVFTSTIVRSTGAALASAIGRAGDPPPEPTSMSAIPAPGTCGAGKWRAAITGSSSSRSIASSGSSSAVRLIFRFQRSRSSKYVPERGASLSGRKTPAFDARAGKSRSEGDRSHEASLSGLPSIDIGRDDGNGRRSDAGDAGRLAERRGPDFIQPLDHFAGEPGDRGKREGLAGCARSSCFRSRSMDASWRRRYPSYLNSVSTLARSRDVCDGGLSNSIWPADTRLDSLTSGCLSALAAGTRPAPATVTTARRIRPQFSFETAPPRFESRPTHVVHETRLASSRCQTQIGVVGPEQKPVFGARGEHPVRLQASFRDEVVDEDADIRLVPPKNERRLTRRMPRGVQSGDQTLGCCLLVAGRSVDLPGEKQTAHSPGFQRRTELRRLNEVVLHGVARTQYRGRPRDPAAHGRASSAVLQAGSWRSRSCRSRRRPGLRAPGRSGGARDARIASPCLRTRGSSADRCRLSDR